MSSIRSRALRYLRNERVRIVAAATPVGELRPFDVTALVQGHQERRTVRFDGSEWSCSCTRVECAHIAAVQLVTGWPSAASKEFHP